MQAGCNGGGRDWEICKNSNEYNTYCDQTPRELLSQEKGVDAKHLFPKTHPMEREALGMFDPD